MKMKSRLVSTILIVFLPMTSALAAEKDLKAADLIGDYELAKAVEGDCSESLSIWKYGPDTVSILTNGLKPATLGLNLTLDFKELNAGPRTEAFRNGLSGQFAGWNRTNKSLEGDVLVLQSTAYTPFWIQYWQQEITAVVKGDYFSYMIKETEYQSFSMKNTSNQCVYKKRPSP